MKARVSRCLVVTAILVLAITTGSATAWAASNNPCAAPPNYSPDFTNNQGCVTNNGTAGFVSNALQLTSNTNNQAGSAWYNLKQPVQNGFSTTFQFSFANPSSDGGK